MLDIKNLAVMIEAQPILQNINLEIPEGKITTIVGQNGSGKSTIIKCITKQRPYGGMIKKHGVDIKNIDKNYISEIALLTQHSSYPRFISVKEYLYIPFNTQKQRTRNHQKYREYYEEIMSLCELQAFEHRRLEDLSGGQRQRVLLAFCLMKAPKILILDEPTTFLDQNSQIYILSLIKKINQKIKLSVIMILHDIEQALNFSDNLIVLYNGQLKLCQKINRLNNYDFIKKYLNLNVDVKKENNWFYLQHKYEEI